jgi:hypothetical protein
VDFGGGLEEEVRLQEIYGIVRKHRKSTRAVAF